MFPEATKYFGWPMAILFGTPAQVYMSVLNEQVPVGWSNIDPAMLDGSTILGMNSGKLSCGGENLRQMAGRKRLHVNDYKNGGRQVSGQGTHQPLQSLDASG